MRKILLATSAVFLIKLLMGLWYYRLAFLFCDNISNKNPLSIKDVTIRQLGGHKLELTVNFHETIFL